MDERYDIRHVCFNDIRLDIADGKIRNISSGRGRL